MTSAFEGRRAALAKRVGDRPILFGSGAASPRNYRANTFPFRAGSHFLYLTGLSIPHAMLLFASGEWALFLPEVTPDDALWHGPRKALTDVGCTVRGLAELEGVLAKVRSSVATLPAIDALTCKEQSRLLGRTIELGTLALVDEPLADAMIALRLVHDEAAVTEMRRASATTARAHSSGMERTRIGARESDVCAWMELPIAEDGGVPAYGSIVTTRGEVLHNDAHDGVLAAGDLLLADVGAESAGFFASDVTRTWPVSGSFSTTQREYYEVVLRAQVRAIDAVKPGVSYREIHRLASVALAEGLVALGVLRGDPEALVAEGAHALFFPHGVGHLLGLDVHDMEDLGDRAGYAKGRTRSSQFGLGYLRMDRDLVPGMAVTIEPGLYHVPAILEHPDLKHLVDRFVHRETLARFNDVRGIRIEDDVLVTDTGCEVLTRAIPKDAAAIEAAVGAGFV